MSDASGNKARRQLKLSEIDFVIVHFTGIKHNATNEPSRLSTADTTKTKPEDKTRAKDIILETFQLVYNIGIGLEMDGTEVYSTRREIFVLFFPVVHILAGKIEELQPDTRDLLGYMRTQTDDKDYCLTEAAAKQRKTSFHTIPTIYSYGCHKWTRRH